MRNTALLVFGLTSIACSSLRNVDVHVNAIDATEKEIPCAIFFEDQPLLDASEKPILTPAWVTLPFDLQRAEEKLTVRPTDSDSFQENSRPIRSSDAKRQLFVLRKAKVSKP